MNARRPTVAIVGTVGIPPRYGGFETLAHFLVSNLAHQNEFIVYCSAPSYPERPPGYLGARLKYIHLNANGSQSVLYDGLSLLDSCFRADTVLVLGVSGGFFIPLLRLFRKHVVLNIGGVEWARSKWGKWASRFLKLSEKVAVRSAHTLISDNVGIATYLERQYGMKSIMIEYGGDQITCPPLTDGRRKKYPFVNGPYAFSVARIQSDNNIEMILRGFASTPSHVLAFVGNWNASKFGKTLRDRFSIYPNLYLIDAIYDPVELNSLRGHCSIYVHGHSGGGTNPSLVEAMNFGLPIAAFDVIYNRETTENRARYFSNHVELCQLLEQVSPAEWEYQRTSMKEIADRRYRWSIIVSKYADVLGMRFRDQISNTEDCVL